MNFKEELMNSTIVSLASTHFMLDLVVSEMLGFDFYFVPFGNYEC